MRPHAIRIALTLSIVAMICTIAPVRAESRPHVLKGTGRSEAEIGFGWSSTPPGWVVIAQGDSQGDSPSDRWRLFRRE